MKSAEYRQMSDEQLTLFLVLFLFYCAYFMLRFSVDPGPQPALS